MTVQEVARAVMQVSGMTQQAIAEKAGRSGQAAIAMYLKSKSMRVEAFTMILDACGYELVARSKSGNYPEFVIGDEATEAPKQEIVGKTDELREMIREILAEELAKGTPGRKKKG